MSVMGHPTFSRGKIECEWGQALQSATKMADKNNGGQARQADRPSIY